MQSFVKVRLIIWRRDGGGTSRADSATCGRHGCVCVGDSASYFWGRFWVISLASRREPESLWFSGCQAFLRRGAKERENAVHLRSARSRELCECLVSSWRIAALLVSQAASGAADEYIGRAISYISRRHLEGPRFCQRGGGSPLSPSSILGRSLPPPEKRLKSG